MKKANLFIMVVLFVSLSAILISIFPESFSAPSQDKLTWEYKLYSFKSLESVEGELDALGQEGWELVSIIPENKLIEGVILQTVKYTAIFKRP